MKSRKLIILILIILTTLLMTACTNGEQNFEITEEDIEIIRDLTFQDVEEELTYAIEDFVADYSYLEIANLEFTQDKLAVDSINQVKKFNNIEMRLRLEIDAEEADIDLEDELTMEYNFSDFVSAIEDDLIASLISDQPYEFSMVITTDINFVDREHNLGHGSVSGNVRDSNTITTLRNEESEAEKLALEKTFDLIREDLETYQLSRFGIIENIFIIDFFDYPAEGEPSLTMEELSEKLFKLVREDLDFIEYMDNQADQLLVMFNEESFNYDLNNK